MDYKTVRILGGSGFLTDLYEITMAAVYHREFSGVTATFELWVRELPAERGYLLACGLEDAVSYLLNFHFDREEISYLKAHPSLRRLDRSFFEMLRKVRFTGNLWAVPEGTVFFAGEPVLRVEAPIIEAQLVETALLNLITYNTAVATKASRVCYAASVDGRKRSVVEFGARRAPGPTASVSASRASYIGGCDGTSNLYAGKVYGIPTSGTMAHSFVLAHRRELEAFKQYHRTFKDSAVLLIDTYDTIKAAKKLSVVGRDIKAVRVDSGDVLRISKRVREILNSQGLEKTTIFVSGDLDEYKIERLVRNRAPIDGFGVGTRMVTSSDSPYLGTIYKLVQVERGGRVSYVAKFSDKKVTFPGSKQVIRFENGGRFAEDAIINSEERIPRGGTPLLRRVIENGRLVEKLPQISEIRDYAAEQLSKLPPEVKKIERPQPYPVVFSRRISKILKRLKDVET